MSDAQAIAADPGELFDASIENALDSELRSLPTVWGLTPIQLHDRYWASRGVCVVRCGERSELPREAELFLLTGRTTLALFSLGAVANRMYWVDPLVIFIRLRGRREPFYREFVRKDGLGRFLGFQRQYAPPRVPATRLALSRNRRIAEMWQSTRSPSASAWRSLSHAVRNERHEAFVTTGRAFRADDDADLNALSMGLVSRWSNPSATIDGLMRLASGVWGPDPEASSTPGAQGRSLREPVDARHLQVAGHVWIGVGRDLSEQKSVVGPAILWDDPEQRPAAPALRWATLEPTEHSAAVTAQVVRRASSSRSRTFRRAFDLVFSILALAITLPLYPLIMLAIWLEDGRPWFFTQQRETLGGLEFPCLKFRTMRRDADAIKAQLMKANQSDGPQFFIQNDPRVTRVGRFLRRTNLDEVPQFLNVLAGDMSVVGPRPSPRHENQCCPAWREARLSIKPGVTGLWQVNRTRTQGLDFQEWIRFDVEYVERNNLLLDLRIIAKTILKCLRPN